MFGSLSPRVDALQWVVYSFVISSAIAYDAPSRWGQATALVNNVVFVYGGKTDPFNQFSYTAAPNNNDILTLSLSSQFSGTSPPWQLVTTSANQSNPALPEGPALAWSTLSASNNTLALLFGGEIDGASPLNNVTAELLDVFSSTQPYWSLQLAATPPPRMRHSSATASSGLVFIVGGEKPDGSGNALSDHFFFNVSSLSFTSLPTDNAPPDIYGHVSIMLSDGRLLVFGGYSPSQDLALEFSTIWVLDSAVLTWTIVNTTSFSLPSPRVAFAAVLMEGGKIIIHGGSDPSFLANYDDGWLLDTTQNPMVWTAVDALSQLGARRDHFAVPSGDQVIFGYGYADNGPASASLQIYNITSQNFSPSYVPPSVTDAPTQTLPQPTSSYSGNSVTSSSRQYSSTVGVNPTSTYNPHDTKGHSGSDNSSTSSVSRTTAIAVGTSLSIIALILVGLGAVYYIRKRRRVGQDDHFVPIGDDEGRGSPHFDGDIPAANIIDDEPPRHNRLLSTLGISGAISAAAKMRSIRHATMARRDMLADEDTRSLREWYNSSRRDGMGNSSWSLLNILGGARRSRNASTTSNGTGGRPSPWQEKSDPFGDGSSIGHDEEMGLLGAGVFASKPSSRRETSHASSRSAISYRDPFLDPLLESDKLDFSPTELYNEHAATSIDSAKVQPSVRYVPPLTVLRPLVPLSQQVAHPLSPLSEHTSQSTLPQFVSSSGSSNTHSSENVIFSPVTGGSASHTTSRTSLSAMPTPISPTSSPALGAHPDNTLYVPTQPMRRSDSWWARFSRTSLLDRRSSTASKVKPVYDIRDPAPPPKLMAIEEASLRSAAIPSQKSRPGSTGSPGSNEQSPSAAESERKSVYAKTSHGKSVSSVRTADTEAIEQMAGAMDVVRRESHHRWSASVSSQGGISFDTQSSTSEVNENQTLAGNAPESRFIGKDDTYVSSPFEEIITPLTSAPSRLHSPPPVQKALRFAPIPPPPPADSRTSTSSTVSGRVQAYERRMSLDEPSSPPPTNTKYREERTKKRVEVDFGLVPRPSLFVANPDHHSNTSSSSS